MTPSNAYAELALCVLALLGMPAYGQPTSQTDAASRLRTVLAALNSDVNSIRGPLQKDKGKSRTYQATVALIPESLDECTLNMYGSPDSTFWSNTYSCWWTNESVEPLRRAYAKLLSTLKAVCGVEESVDKKGSQISGKCGDEVEVKAQFGKEKDGDYFLFVDLERQSK